MTDILKFISAVLLTASITMIAVDASRQNKKKQKTNGSKAAVEPLTVLGYVGISLMVISIICFLFSYYLSVKMANRMTEGGYHPIM